MEARKHNKARAVNHMRFKAEPINPFNVNILYIKKRFTSVRSGVKVSDAAMTSNSPLII
jgi:hypothetical protein